MEEPSAEGAYALVAGAELRPAGEYFHFRAALRPSLHEQCRDQNHLCRDQRSRADHASLVALPHGRFSKPHQRSWWNPARTDAPARQLSPIDLSGTQAKRRQRNAVRWFPVEHAKPELGHGLYAGLLVP